MMLVVLMATTMWGQSLVENAAAAAGGSVGGVAGKKVGEGLSNIFEKIDRSAAKAAKTGDTKPSPSSTPLMEVGPGVPKRAESVPPPPKPVIHHAAVRKVAHVAPALPPAPVVIEPPPLPPPPPPEVTRNDLKKVKDGMDRDDLLKLGLPSERITMFDEGHLVEIYRYLAKDMTIGVVHLTDGAVSSIQMP